MSYPPPYPPSPWGPPGYGPPGWPPAPAPQRSRRRTVAWVVGGAVLAALVLTVVVLAGLRVGRDGAPAFAAGAGAGIAGSATVITAPPSDWAGLGDDEGLDSYAQRCHDGDMQACDDLYALSDVMSRYEQYGVTCGGRVKAASLVSCTALDDD